MEQSDLHDSLADFSTWMLGAPREDMQAMSVPAYLCPATPSAEHVSDKAVLRPSLQRPAGSTRLSTSDAAAFWHVAFPDANGVWVTKPGAWYPYRRSFGDVSYRDRGESLGFDQAKLKYITDGLSNTVLVGERAGNSYGVNCWLLVRLPETQTRTTVNIWTASPPTGRLTTGGALFSFHDGGVNLGMCDGAVRFLSEETEQQVVGRLLSRDEAAWASTAN